LADIFSGADRRRKFEEQRVEISTRQRGDTLEKRQKY
jgi:hypothetical protein